MKKSIILFVILNICAINLLHSQWLEKEGYWELSEKIPDLRDLKILPEENLIITVSKDNTIRHIEYDSGKILKSGKPAELTDDNDYAKISSDGKTTVVARYVKNENDMKNEVIRDIELVLIDNDKYELFSPYKFYADSLSNVNLHVTEYVLNEFQPVISFWDYNKIKNELIMNINYSVSQNGTSHNTGGTMRYTYSSGNLFKGKITNGALHFELVLDDKGMEDIIFDKEQNIYILTNYKSFGSGNAHFSQFSTGNIIAELSVNLDNYKAIKEYSFTRNRETPYDLPSSEIVSGYLFPIYQIHNSKQNNNYYIKTDKKLFTFDKLQNKFTDSIQHNIFSGDVYITNNDNNIHCINSGKYSVYSKRHMVEIFSFNLKNNLIISQPFIDEVNENVLLCNSDRTVIKLKPSVFKQVPDYGFYTFNKISYVNDVVYFYPITNVDSCTFEWEFEPDSLLSTKEKIASYRYMNSGEYDITLKITAPDGSIYNFKKEKLITILERVVADFEFSIENSEIPLKVKFNDKSKGALKSWKWDFGDGTTSTEQNPIHEYMYPGDFSPGLTVSDGYTTKSIRKYEAIIIKSKFPEFITDYKSIAYKFNMQNGYRNHAFYKTSFGFSQIAFEEWSEPEDVGWGEIDYLGIRVANYDNQFNLLKYSKFNITDMWTNNNSILMDGKFSNDILPINFAKDEVWFLNLTTHKVEFKETSFLNWIRYSNSIIDNRDSTAFWVSDNKQQTKVIKSNYSREILWEYDIFRSNNLVQFADTLDGEIFVIIKNSKKMYELFNIDSTGKLVDNKYFKLDSNAIISLIEVVNVDLILFFGSIPDTKNKTSYAYFAKYKTSTNEVTDTLIYSRTSIDRVARINKSQYIAIGNSRGSQGFLILDSNLKILYDNRINRLYGKLVDLMILDNQVYLFVLDGLLIIPLPEDILLSVDDSPIIFTDKLIHSAYPNPTNEALNLKVSTNESANYTIKLYDIFGMEILNIHDGFIPANSEKIFSIPTSALPIGSYYYVISGGGLVERGKVMVMR